MHHKISLFSGQKILSSKSHKLTDIYSVSISTIHIFCCDTRLDILNIVLYGFPLAQWPTRGCEALSQAKKEATI